MTMARDFFALWTWPLEMMRLGSDLADTMVGARTVIAARLPLIGQALIDPLNADHRELGRMVTEKVSALRISEKSMAAAGRSAQDAATSNAVAVGTLAIGGLLWPNDWLRLFETNLAAAAALATLPAMALAPIRRGVIANERRLRGSNATYAR